MLSRSVISDESLVMRMIRDETGLTWAHSEQDGLIKLVAWISACVVLCCVVWCGARVSQGVSQSWVGIDTQQGRAGASYMQGTEGMKGVKEYEVKIRIGHIRLQNANEGNEKKRKECQGKQGRIWNRWSGEREMQQYRAVELLIKNKLIKFS